MKITEMNYGIVGLGLMGGSLAKAIRQNILSQHNATGKIFAAGRNKAAMSQAKDEGVIDDFFLSNGEKDETSEMLKKCDFVFVCLYPHMTLDFFIEHKNDFKQGSILTDISGVKTLIMENLSDFERDDVDFIAGHPMAGSEKEGYANSSGSIFKNRNYILMPREKSKPENIESFKRIITEIGFGRIIETDYINHDKKIAFTSQLCHVIASSLVDSAEDEKITAFGGGSFEDLTRIAMINAPLWTELFISNKKQLLEQIEFFEASLKEIKDLIYNEDDKALVDYLENVRKKRINMSVLH